MLRGVSKVVISMTVTDRNPLRRRRVRTEELGRTPVVKLLEICEHSGSKSVGKSNTTVLTGVRRRDRSMRGT